MRSIIILAISLWLAWPAGVLAEVVGHLTQVEGRVELLKSGKLPAAEAKAKDGVEPGDVLRTKSLSRAQITFLDNTTVTISPESRIAIEEYLFDPAKGKRSAVMQLFQGLAHFVVSQVYKVEEPDFIVKTHTGVMGVRGTDVGIRLSPNDTTFLNFKGLIRVANIFPEVSETFKKADKIAAYSSRGLVADLQNILRGPGAADQKEGTGSIVAMNMKPMFFDQTDHDRQLFNRQMQYGPQGRSGGNGFSGGGPSGLADNLPNAVNPAFTNRLATLFNDITITPRLAFAATGPKGPAATPTESFTFSQTFAGGGVTLLASGGNLTGNFSGSFSSVSRSVAYPGTFTTNLLNFVATAPGPSPVFFSNAGTLTVTSNSFSVSGHPGATFTGTGTMQASAVNSGAPFATLNLTGPVSISPNGAMTFTPGASSFATTPSGSGHGTGILTSTNTPGSGTGTGSPASITPSVSGTGTRSGTSR